LIGYNIIPFLLANTFLVLTDTELISCFATLALLRW